MTGPFDLPLPSGASVGGTILSPLEGLDGVPTVVDVGARSGMFLLPESYTREGRLIGFEPNPDEYRKLVEGKTDAVLAGLPPPPRFRTEQLFDCAVWDREERRTFYITQGPGACTMMGGTNENVTGRMFLDQSGAPGREPYSELHTRVIGTEEMDCRPLDDVVDGGKIDFLKIDVEGAELRVLRGAEKLLAERRILFVKTEFACFPYYDEHPVFGEQHAFLNERGFRLLDLDFDQPVYSRSPTRIPDTVDRRPKYAGDAYFALDPDRGELDALDLQRLAAISLILGFRSFCVSLLGDAGLLSPRQISEIEAALARVPMKKRLIVAWRRFPFVVQRALNALGLDV